MTKKLLFLISILLIFKVSGAKNNNTDFKKTSSPTIFNFRIESSNPNRIYFDSDKPISGSSIKGFTVSGKPISVLKINSGQLSNHYFTMSSAFTFWDNNTIRYEGGSDIGIDKFDLSYIKNNIPQPKATQKIYYVTLNGNDKNDGSSENASFRTIKKASQVATAGSTIWIKAGDYGSEYVAFKNDGGINNPIVIKGYKNSIGDLDGKMYFKYSTNSKLNSSEMPLFRGNNNGTGLSFTGDYTIVKNIQIENYLRNIFIPSKITGVIIDNCLMHGTPQVGYVGYNVRSSNPKSKNVRIINSIAVNGGIANIDVVGDYNLIDNCKVFADFRESSDYYYGLRGNNNILINSYAERAQNNGHSGHGLSVKGESVRTEYNLIENCTVVNIYMAIEARHDEVKYNVYRNIKCLRNSSVAKKGAGGIWIQNGASYNVFDGILVNDVRSGIVIISSTEDRSAPSGGHHNIIKNSVFSNTTFGIANRTDNSGQNRIEHDNTIANSIFYNIDYLLHQESPKSGYGNIIVNSIISNTLKKENLNNNKFGWVYQNSNFYKNTKFNTPSGNNNISVDSKFENEKSGNFKLKSNSPLIDAGKNLDYINRDIDGNGRPQGGSTDIGAYEYNDNTTGAINVDAGGDVEICKGSETILTATGNGDFLWNTGETTASITVSPEETTKYTVTVSSDGKSKSDDVLVTITEQPVVTLGDDLSICSGAEVTITAEGSGNFLWSTGVTASSITVTPSVTTEYIVILSSTCGTETLSVSDTIKINVIPAITLNAGEDVAVCLGTEVTLTAEGNDNFLWNTGETTASITVNPTETTTYSVVSGSGECKITDEVVVTISEQPEVNLGNDLSICSGNEVTLTAEGSGDFLWSTGETSPSITVNPAETTEYIVTASTVCGNETLSVSDTLVVNVTPGTNLNAGNDITVCSGTEVTLTAESNGTFLWNTGETTASITVNPSITTTYSVTSGTGECEVTDEVTVTISEQPEVALGDDLSICSGNEVTLTAEGSGDFLWSTGEISSSITVNPEETTEYIVTASTICGGETLSVSDTLIVNVTPSITLNAGNDVSVCAGIEVLLTAEGNGDFLWNTGETTASITVNPTETTTYSVTSGSGTCKVTDEVVVIVSEKPEVSLGDDLTICSGNEVTLTAEGSGDFLWSTGETSSSITVKPTETTEYTVTASSICGGETLSVSSTLVVNVTPAITLNAGDDVAICHGNEVTLTAKGNGDFLWNTGETTASITVSPEEDTTYTVTSGTGDCKVIDEVSVTVDVSPSILDAEDQTICYGESVTLTVKGQGNFVWNNGKKGKSLTVNPTETTIYTVTSSSPCSFPVTNEIIVFVTEEVVVDAGDDVTICNGDNVTLTAEGNGDFLWSTGETTANITVKPSASTKYWVTSSIEECAVLDEVFVNVENAPSVSLGEDVSICPGELITLTAEGFGNFLWSTGETTSDIKVSPESNTTFTVTATSSCGDTEVTDDLVVTVNEPIYADAGDSIIIEEGQSIQLTATGGNTYLWSTGETTANIMVEPDTTTIYTVEVSNEGYSCSETDSVEVGVVSNGADSSDTDVNLTINSGEREITICGGDEITLTAKGALHYLWNTKSVSSSITVNPQQTETYNVSALRNGVLETAEITIIVRDCATNKIAEFKIYPNPTTGIVNIHLPSQKTKLKLQLISLNGQLVYSKQVKADRNGVFTQIDLSSFSKGVYLLKLYSDEFNETKKIMVI